MESGSLPVFDPKTDVSSDEGYRRRPIFGTCLGNYYSIYIVQYCPNDSIQLIRILYRILSDISILRSFVVHYASTLERIAAVNSPTKQEKNVEISDVHDGNGVPRDILCSA